MNDYIYIYMYVCVCDLFHQDFFAIIVAQYFYRPISRFQHDTRLWARSRDSRSLPPQLNGPKRLGRVNLCNQLMVVTRLVI